MPLWKLISFSAGGDPDAEPGARLTCHLIRRLFKKAYSPPGVYHIGNPPAVPANSTTRRNMYYIKYPCDRHLLSAIHSGMRVEAILAVLKGFLVIGKFGMVCHLIKSHLHITILNFF